MVSSTSLSLIDTNLDFSLNTPSYMRFIGYPPRYRHSLRLIHLINQLVLILSYPNPYNHATDISEHHPFSAKTQSQAVWRGTITGIFHRSRWDWRNSHRDRLSFLASDNTSKKVEVLEEGLLRGVRSREWGLKGLGKRWLDVGVIEEVSSSNPVKKCHTDVLLGHT
jgi:hypothetical protein